MPNHVYNRLTVTGPHDRLQEMLTRVKDDKEGVGSFDFNKLIPMPESLNIECSARTTEGLKMYKEFCKVTEILPLAVEEELLREYQKDHPEFTDDLFNLGKTALNNLRQYGSVDWYDWSIRNWDTKWNAYGLIPLAWNSDEECTFGFYTAWTAPEEVIKKLAAEYSDLHITHVWVNEDLGSGFHGLAVYENGDEHEHYEPESDDEIVKFVRTYFDEDFELEDED